MTQGTADIQGVQLFYETNGHGVPVLFISGLGSSTESWARQVPVLEAQHLLVRFDNRGAGEAMYRTDPTP
jgi:pimeloyl-ACP methyl ester carboxylesterase